MFAKVILFLAFVLLVGCEDQRSAEGNADQVFLKQLVSGETSTGQQFNYPDQNKPLKFPEAHWPQKNFRHGWWYLTANLTATDGRHFALQWTLFRTNIQGQQWYFAHAALADLQSHQPAFRQGRKLLGNVEIAEKPFILQIDDWHWRAESTTASVLFPAMLSVGDLHGDHPWQANLQLTSHSPFFLHGDNGISRKHDTLPIASYYYSQPFIDVQGQILWQGQQFQVSGQGWYDREYGSSLLAKDQRGWDWFSLRLSPELCLMVYRLRGRDKNYLSGSLMNRSGDIVYLSEQQIKLAVAEHQSHYPQHFKIIVPQHGINIELSVLNPKQIMPFGIEYFEGMVNFYGSHHGEGFVELTGY